MHSLLLIYNCRLFVLRIYVRNLTYISYASYTTATVSRCLFFLSSSTLTTILYPRRESGSKLLHKPLLFQARRFLIISFHTLTTSFVLRNFSVLCVELHPFARVSLLPGDLDLWPLELLIFVIRVEDATFSQIFGRFAPFPLRRTRKRAANRQKVDSRHDRFVMGTWRVFRQKITCSHAIMPDPSHGTNFDSTSVHEQNVNSFISALKIVLFRRAFKI